MQILVTGGTGYIGSHTVVELLKSGKEVVIVDNLSNSSKNVIDNIEKITNKKCKFYEIDIRDEKGLEKVFEENDIEAVIHFAGLKAVGESVVKPLEYYDNNVIGTIKLLEVMKKFVCKKMVFSSSATVYGDPGNPKYVEDMGRGKASSPYGATKAVIEEMLESLYIADNEWTISLLRYFNPIGAHESGLIGENPNGIPNNLMPYIQKVAIGELKELSIFGDNYNTKDGTCIRDYIHVVDLAVGHMKALQKLNKPGVYIHNLGTGAGTSVLDIVKTFEKVNNIKVNYKFAPRRAGDLPEFFADPSKAKSELDWEAKRGLEEMCRDSWNFISKNRNS